ncbi:nucleotide-sugar transporter family protein [Actinidia rufa]|uniref:Nucleotide-sugar transporter family protein n=1 Tax=Actinidia rufa TaxID=165716 RepID=A0A7J0E4S6_9ERIC|nr:nucleotide-sugar transporter family protein [Actinidia rufa]
METNGGGGRGEWQVVTAGWVLVIAVLLKIIMRRRFSIIQWEALALLLIGISINQLQSLPEGTTAMGLPVATGAYAYTLIFVTVPSLASVFNEYALKSQYDTSIYLQNLFLYGYGAIFNFLGILVTAIVKGPNSFDILQGHSKATMLLIFNNAAQGILSSFFFKYADTILKKYSSTVATIFHRHSICCVIWPYSDYKLFVRNFSSFHLNAPVLFTPFKVSTFKDMVGITFMANQQN